MGSISYGLVRLNGPMQVYEISYDDLGGRWSLADNTMIVASEHALSSIFVLVNPVLWANHRARLITRSGRRRSVG